MKDIPGFDSGFTCHDNSWRLTRGHRSIGASIFTGIVMADRTIAAAREENGDLSWDDNIESLDWENDEREANQHASYGMKGWLRTAFRFLGPFALGVSRQRAKSAHTTPLMHSMRDRITTNDTAHAIGTDKLVSGKNRCWKRRPWLIAGKSSLVVIILALTVL